MRMDRRRLLACNSSQAILFLLCCISISFIISILARSIEIHTCSRPILRLEWRSLRPEEKRDYIRAVQCLEKTLSSLTGQGSMYDDFVYVHMTIGQRSHNASSFLPWHRAFLHIYERTLIDRCGYQGVMPYWNWELDWQSLERSSTWNDSQGFGGDGDKKGAWTPGMGRCVVDGPFKNAQRLYFNGDVQPHCLGRGFVHFMTGKQGVLFGEWFSPEQIGELKRSKDYDSMRHTLENSLHNVLHWGIKGDFASITAANDPVFWLHHAQLDRLWWQWQQAEPRRFSEYHGKAFSESLPGLERGATLDDRLTFSGMWEDIRVSDVMSPDNGLLCYKY